MGYIISVSNNKFKNLVYPDLLNKIEIVEQSGNNLPIFTMSFRDGNVDKLSYLNELNPITVSFQNENAMLNSSWVIKRMIPVEHTDFFDCACGGYLNNFEYLKNCKTQYVNGTSQEAMTEIASHYFTVRDEGRSTNDKMVWLRNGRTARNFLQETWKHSYSPESPIMIAINSKGEFLRTDLVTILSKEPKARFSQVIKEGYTLYTQGFSAQDSLEQTSMFGYETSRDIYDELTGKTIVSSLKPEVVMTTSNQMNEAVALVGKRELTPLFQSRNVHPHWWEALHQNLVKISSLENNSKLITVTNGSLDLQLLDLIYIEAVEEGQSKLTGGYYIIDRIEYLITGTGEVTASYKCIREVSQETKEYVEDSGLGNFETYTA